MSNVGLEFATAVNWYEIAKALDYGKSNLDSETYKKVVGNFKKMIKHILLWVLIAMAVGGGIAAISKYVSDAKMNALLESNNATQWVTGVRADATTVQYTRGESYRYDVSALGINLDSDFPEQRSLILLLDDNNQLQNVISQKEFEKISNIFPIGLVLWMVVAAVILIGYAIYIRKRASYGRKWYAFMKWVNTGDESLLNMLKEDC